MRRALFLLALPSLAAGQIQAPNPIDASGNSAIPLSAPTYTLTPTSTAPAAPASGVTSFALRPVAASMPSWLMKIGPATQIGVGETFPFVGGGRGFWACSIPTLSSTGINAVGGGALSGQGTAAAASFDSTTLLGRTHRVQYNSAASTNSYAGVNSGVRMWRGNGAGKGGFFWWGSWSPQTATAGQRYLAGLSAGLITAANNPSSGSDTVYFGCDSGDTNYSICSNDNAGSATCNTLGASFPCNTVGAFYTGYLWAAPGDTSIGWAIERLDSPASASGSIVSDLPRNTVMLAWQVLNNTAANSGASSIQFAGACHWANP